MFYHLFHCNNGTCVTKLFDNKDIMVISGQFLNNVIEKVCFIKVFSEEKGEKPHLSVQFLTELFSPHIGIYSMIQNDNIQLLWPFYIVLWHAKSNI